MPELAIHSATKQQLGRFVSRPAHALALSGPLGIGKTALAYQLAANILNIPTEQLERYPYLRHIQPDGSSISIETIRELITFLKLKTVGTGDIRRVAIIEHAEAMTLEAQNALLKTLEEPPEDSLIILTISQASAMLPTVMSRLQTIVIHEPSLSQVRAAFPEATPNFDQLYRLSGGLPGLMYSLTNELDDSPLPVAVSTARRLLQESLFERLAEVDGLARQKLEVAALLQVLMRMALAAIKQAANSEDRVSLRRWQKVLNSTYEATTAAQKGGQTKLLLTGLMLEL